MGVYCRRPAIVFAVLCGLLWCAASPGRAAVSSTGEINVFDEPAGSVPTSSTPTLILTLLVDRSQAEPGEEIKTVEVLLPTGFSVTPEDIVSVIVDGVSAQFQDAILATAMRIVLEREIDNFLSSIIEITFNVRTPELPRREALFQVALRNLSDARIGEFIKPGEIDGDPTNNNDYTLEVIPNVPPAPPTGLTAAADPDGDNDAIVKWRRVDDADVRGYFLFRDGETRFDVIGADSTTYRDVNVSPGTHSYAVAAYKSRLVVSPRTDSTIVLVSRDTWAPARVSSLALAQVSQGIELKWSPSGSADVVRYDVQFGRAEAASRLIESLDVDPKATEYLYIHRDTLEIGRYEYAVTAVDEEGNVSDPRVERLVLSQEPFPNPFTPTSSDPMYNRVRFPRRAIPDAEGDLNMRVFDLHGREVWSDVVPGGNAEWDGRDLMGELLPGGVYVYQIEIGGRFRIGTVVLVR